MNDRTQFERLVADRIADEPRSVPLRSTFVTEFTARAGRTGQRPRWLALIKEPPMRTDSHLSVGSPTVRVAAILAATLMLAVALAAVGVAGTRLLAAGPIIVAADGSGTVSTISEAVAMANDGDTILVRPGEYTESVVVDKDVEIAGDGQPSDIIVRIPEDGPLVPFHVGSVRYAFDLSDSEATVRDLTITGPPQDSGAFVVRRGSPTLEGLVVDLQGWGLDEERLQGMAFVGIDASLTLHEIGSNSLLWVGEGGSAQMTDSRYLRDGSPGFEVHVVDGSHATVHGNALNHVGVRDGSTALIEDNTFIGGLQSCGVDLRAAGDGAVVSGNEIESHDVSVCVAGGSGSVIEDNRLSAPWFTALRVEDGDPVISGNTITSSPTGLSIANGSPTLADNVIEGNRVGLKLTDGSRPTMTGNRICGNTTDMEWPEGSEAPDTSANLACEGD